MVLFFDCSDPQYTVYMGKDKFENEELLKYGWPEDIWFHVDRLSSAHVYLRLPPGSVDLHQVKDKDEAKRRLMAAVESVPETVMMEMCQLVKENSIEGCKTPACDIVYTPYLNLKKEERMDVGQVGFKDESFRLLKKAIEKDKEIVKNIEKTRREKQVDLKQEKEDRDAQERAERKKRAAEQKKQEVAEQKQRAQEKELREYSSLQYLDKTSNADVSKTKSIEECRQIEEDFM